MAATTRLETIRALSRYRPFEGGGASVKEAHQDLALAALAEAGGQCESVAACREAIQTLYRIDLAELSLAAALKTLLEEKRVERRHEGFCLSGAEATRLEQVAADSQATASAAVDDWREMLKDRWPLRAAELDTLVVQLAAYLRTVLRRHGAEATMLLYPEEPAAQALYAELEEEGFDFLPKIDSAHLRDIRDIALSEFIRHPTEAQRSYLAQNLNTAYFMTVLSIDPEGGRLVSEIAEGQVVYLDTNFIYRLLGVQGPRFVRPAEEVLRVTQATGYSTRITPWTLDEFKTSLHRSREFIQKFPIPPGEYAEIAASATSDDNFVTEYWRRVRSGVKAVDFFQYFDEVETHLHGRDIAVDKTGCTAVNQLDSQITDEMAVLARASRGRYRHPALLEHDVKHRMLVKRLRGEGGRNFSNAGYWFLTHDSVLPRYDHLSSETASDLPFCVSVGAWFQIVEAFRPKTEDLEQSLADMLASPYVRYRRSLSQRHAVEIVARVSQFEGGTPELATRVFMNSAALNEIESAATEEETTQKIDNAIVAAAREAQEDARLAREIADQERQRADEATREADRRAELAMQEAKRAIEVAEAASRDETERARVRAEEQVRVAEERHAAELEEKDRLLSHARSARSDAVRRLYFFSACVVVILVFAFTDAVAGLGAAWSLLVAVGVVVAILAAISQLARFRSNRREPRQ